MATNYPINPRVRAYGKARLDIAQRAHTPEEWQSLWLPPAHKYPFIWGAPWKQCIEYKVDDLAAEVGFYIDVLGFPVNAINPDYAMFTSPGSDFYFSVVPAQAGDPSTPPSAIRLQFMLADVLATVEELQGRGIEFESLPEPIREGSDLYIGCFRSPHGIPIEIWGIVSDEDELQIGFDFNEPDQAENDDEVPSIFTTTEAQDTQARSNEPGSWREELETKDDVQYEDIQDESDEGDPEFDYQFEDLET